MTDNYLLYSPQTRPSGERLAEFLGIENHGTEDPDRRVDQLLRWGNSQRIQYVPEEQTINLRRAIAKATDKYKSLEELEKAGVPVPEYSRDMDELEYPMLGREENHSQGSDIVPILQRKDLEVADSTPDYFTQYIPVKREYRVHVIDSQIVKVSQKVLEEEEDYNPWIRNYENGYRFVNPRERHAGINQAISAVNSLELDFGAVDLIIDENDQPYVLEVNTAPSLQEGVSLEVYGEHIADMMGIELEEQEPETEESEETTDYSSVIPNPLSRV